MLRSDSQRKWEESRDTVPVSAGGQDQERAERSGGGRDDPHSRALQQVHAANSVDAFAPRQNIGLKPISDQPNFF